MEAAALKSTPIHNPTKTHLGNTVLNKTQIGFCHILRNGREFNGVRCRSAVKEKGNDECGFVEKGHLEFYGERKEKGKGKKGWGEMKAKKRLKLLKGLVDDLEEFSELGFGLGLDCDVDQYKSFLINQAAGVLLAQLKELRGEEEKKKKKEKSRMEEDCESSSSSSSESSDSECDAVVDLKYMKGKTVTQVCNQKLPLPSTTKPALLTSEASAIKTMSLDPEKECCNMILETTLNDKSSIEVLNETTKSIQLNMGRRIEVCMGGKCRKLGGPALMEEFQRVVGTEGEVVGCKCMGKCKSAPNVRVSNENLVDDSLRTPSNPLYIGVGIEDVSLIVANHFGESDKEFSPPVVALT